MSNEVTAEAFKKLGPAISETNRLVEHVNNTLHSIVRSPSVPDESKGDVSRLANAFQGLSKVQSSYDMKPPSHRSLTRFTVSFRGCLEVTGTREYFSSSFPK